MRVTHSDATNSYQPPPLPTEKHDFWRTVFRGLPQGIALIDARGIHLDVNPALCRMTGFGREELIGKGRPYPYWGPNSAQQMNAVINAADCGHPFEVDLVFRRKMGQSFAVVVQASAIVGEDDSVMCHAVSVRPATEMDRARRALFESEQRLQLALSAAEMGTFDIDFSRGTTMCSPRAQAIHGYGPDEQMPPQLDRFFDRLHPDDATRVKRAVRRHLQSETQTPFEVEYRLRRPSGEYVWVHSRARKLVEPDGTTHLWGFLTDISARKRTEQERERLDAQVRHAQKMETLGTLAGGMAHDFNNLLTPILGASEHLLRTLPEPEPEAHQALSGIVSAARRAKGVVNRILLFSRRNEPAPLARMRVPEVAREALRLLSVSLPSNVRVKTEIDEQCGELLGSSDEVLQAITNLGMNALQALRGSGGQLTIRVRALELDPGFVAIHGVATRGVVVVEVEDDGPGMMPEVLGRVFEPFFSTKPVGEGSGLGLAMVHAIARRHGGTALAHSRPGEGARFELYLARNERAPDAQPTPEPAPPQAKKKKARSQVVCVDDETAVLKTFELIIAHAGHEVTLFTSASQALEYVRNNPGRPDLLITDQTMPELTGLELADELYKVAPDMPVILISGYNDVGADDPQRRNIRLSLCKPVGYDALLQAVGDCLGARATDPEST
jgi:PAS domain S-box-containing protein